MSDVAARQPLTQEQIEAITLSVGTTGKPQVWFTRKELIAAIKAAYNFKAPEPS